MTQRSIRPIVNLSRERKRGKRGNRQSRRSAVSLHFFSSFCTADKAKENRNRAISFSSPEKNH